MSSAGRIGRPRIRPTAPAPRSATPSDDILAAASRLFGERGVTGTTMAQIATGAGLQQSSLYYYFRSKEEILAALVAKANVVPLSSCVGCAASRLAPAVRLYRFVRGDVVALCPLPFDINEVHRYAARDRERFVDVLEGAPDAAVDAGRDHPGGGRRRFAAPGRTSASPRSR